MFLAGFLPASAAVVTVGPDPGDDFSTIQAGINAAGSGDIVSVAPGVYEQAITMKNNVTVIAEGPGTEIYGGNLSAGTIGVTFNSLNNTAVLEGFHIRVFSNDTSTYGGGIRVANGGGTIRNNKITENLSLLGSGMFLENATALVDGNEIIDNIGTEGIGIYVRGGSPALMNNIIDNNIGGRKGAGIYLEDADVEVTNNVINGNIANVSPYQGAGIYVQCSGGSQTTVIYQNIITSNHFESGNASGAGAAVYMESTCPGTWLYSYNATWNIPAGPTILDGKTGFDDTLLGDPTLGNKNGTNPQFFDITGDDFHLQPGSQLIDAGDTFFDPTPGFTFLFLDDGSTHFLDNPASADREGVNRPQAGRLQNDVSNVRFPSMNNPNRSVWNNLSDPFNAYNIYRGLVSNLSFSDFGTCETLLDQLDGGTNFDNVFIDTDVPAIGDGYFFLITGENRGDCGPDLGAYERNEESSLGTSNIITFITMGGSRIYSQPERPNVNACQLTCLDYF